MDSIIDEKLKDILAKVLLINEIEISDGMSRKSVEEWDSMAHLMLVNEIESAFKVTMDDDEIMDILKYSEMALLRRRKLALSKSEMIVYLYLEGL